MLWTLACNGAEKSLADWGLTQFTRRLVSQAQDELSFKADGALADSAPLFTPFVSTVTLWRDRQLAPDGSWSGGVQWFVGLVIQVPRAGSPDAESLAYKAAGPWWYLDNLVFLAPYLNVLLAYTPGDPTSAIFGAANTSHVFLNYDVTGSTPTALLKSTSGKQIIAALEWALKPFVDAGVPAPFQIGAVSPDVDVPIDEVRDITCAEVIHKMLRWSPDSVCWFDYSQNPPAFNCVRYAALPSVNYALNSQLSTVESVRIKSREDLQSDYVLIWYETTNLINGLSQLSGTKDVYPNPPPTDPASQFRALVFTVNLQGFNTSTTSAAIVCDPINLEDKDWWLKRHPELKATDVDPESNISSFVITPGSGRRTPVLVEPDKLLTAELTSGNLAPWMTFKSQRLTVTVEATITHLNRTIETKTLTYQMLSTDGYSGTFSNHTFSTLSEPIPVGLAQNIFQALSILHFEGELTLQEQEVSGSLVVGQVFNLTGSAQSAWATMRAMVLEIEEDIDKGRTRVRFGPPRQLGAGDLVELLRVHRYSLLSNPFTAPVSGNVGGEAAVLGSNTPEKNSSHVDSPSNPHVVSANPDGTGPFASTIADDFNIQTVWTTNPGSNSVTISLADTGGHTLSIRPLNVCQNGISGTVYFLASGFIPDP